MEYGGGEATSNAETKNETTEARGAKKGKTKPPPRAARFSKKKAKRNQRAKMPKTQKMGSARIYTGALRRPFSERIIDF